MTRGQKIKQPGGYFDHPINLHTTPAVAQAIDEHARRQGLSVSAWMRKAVVAALEAEARAA
jgi:hypothetical protein